MERVGYGFGCAETAAFGGRWYVGVGKSLPHVVCARQDRVLLILDVIVSKQKETVQKEAPLK